MTAAVARFRQVERVLDERLASLRANLAEVVVRDLSGRTHHYKNQVLTWCYQLVRDREIDGETTRVSVFLTYSEPLDDQDDLSILVRSEVFQQSQVSRVDRRQEERIPVEQIEQIGIEDLVKRAFERGAQLASA